MGEQIRNLDWSLTPLGSPGRWPLALQISLSNVLNSSFPMFLFWGHDLTCFYNDAFRPSLGAEGKHPAIGKKAVQVWAEIWDFIGPLIDGVLATGKPVWFENQLVPFYRNGRMEEIFWTFSYSLVRNDDGQPGGVLVTCMETTGNITERKRMAESEVKLRSIINSAPTAIGVFAGPDLIVENPNQFLTELIGSGQDIEGKSFRTILAGVVEEHQQFIQLIDGVRNTGEPFEAQEVAVSFKEEAKPRYFNIFFSPLFDKNGTVYGVLDVSVEVTKQVVARQQLQESETRFRNLVMQAPAAMAVLKGPEHVVEVANERVLEIWGRSAEVMLNKPVFEGIPEAKGQGLEELLAGVYQTGKRVSANGVPVTLPRGGNCKTVYLDFVYEAFRDGDGSISGVMVVATEVTEQVTARQRVEGSEAKLKSLIAAAPIAIGLFIGRDLVIENPNQEFIDIVGKGPGIAGKRLTEVMPELIEHGQPYLKILDDVFTSGKMYQSLGDPVNIVRDGVLHNGFYNIYYVPLFDAEGNVYGIMDIATDVTEQVNNRHRIEESETRFRTMAESTDVLIAVDDEAGKASYFNKAWTELTGRLQQDLLAVGWADLVHPDDQKRYTHTYRSAFAVKETYTDEFRVLNKEGAYRWLLIKGVPRFTADGSFAGYISSCVDVTEGKRNEQQLETALEQIQLSKEAAELGTFDLDLERGVLHWDDRCRTLFGIHHLQPVTYEKDFVQGLHPEDRQRILNIIEQTFVKSVSNGSYDVEYRTVGAEDGVVRWVRAKGKVYFNEQEKPLRFIGSVLDITEKVTAIQKIESLVEERTKELAAANESLQAINKELQRSNANLEEFAYAASHDLKEPIRKIHFFTRQLKDQLSSHLKEGETWSFSRIENATERMGNLIDDLLLYSHASQRPHETEAIDLNVKMQRVLEDLEIDIQKKGAVVRVGKLPVVQGYRRQLQQLFQNLLSNALKYSKAGVAPEIELTADETEEAGKPYHVIKIADNGIGFAQEYEEKIFQMFARLHGRAEYSGTGVGLSIVKKVVENHQGMIRVKSAPGQGASFFVYLPK